MNLRSFLTGGILTFSFFLSAESFGSPNADLLEAAKHGRYDAVVSALAAGADPNTRDDIVPGLDGITPTLYAAMGNYEKIVDHLAHQGADVNLKALNNWTPLTMAIDHGALEAVTALLRNHADVELVGLKYHSPLYLASELGNIAIVDSLIQFGASLDVEDSLSQYTPLMIGSAEGHSEVAQLLVRRGADINHMNDAGLTSLTLSARSRHEETLSRLVDLGADVNKGNRQYAITYAAHHGLADSVDLLIAKGADVNVRSHFDNTALHQAVVFDNSRIVLALLGAGAEVDALSMENMTPVMWAAAAGSVESIKILISHHANLSIRDNVEHKSAYDLAIDNGHTAAADLIAKAGGA